MKYYCYYHNKIFRERITHNQFFISDDDRTNEKHRPNMVLVFFFFFESKNNLTISLNETKFHKSYILNETNVFETTQTSGKKTTAIKA
jgi:hypothetical protein